MKSCPTCRAPYRSGSECYPCRTVLDGVLEVEKEADWRQTQAERKLARRNLTAAQGYVNRGLFLHRSGPLLRVAALVALARRHFPAAVGLWREWREVEGRG